MDKIITFKKVYHFWIFNTVLLKAKQNIKTDEKKDHKYDKSDYSREKLY